MNRSAYTTTSQSEEHVAVLKYAQSEGRMVYDTVLTLPEPGLPAAALASATAVVHSAALVSPSRPWFSHVWPYCVRRW